jgi:chemotaxis signal transduction protein
LIEGTVAGQPLEAKWILLRDALVRERFIVEEYGQDTLLAAVDSAATATWVDWSQLQTT